jgi:hypothetical protein
MTWEALLQEALRLPRRERADVAAELLASLDDEPTEDPQELAKLRLKPTRSSWWEKPMWA